jgi:ankyrin repeat protein
MGIINEAISSASSIRKEISSTSASIFSSSSLDPPSEDDNPPTPQLRVTRLTAQNLDRFSNASNSNPLSSALSSSDSTLVRHLKSHGGNNPQTSNHPISLPERNGKENTSREENQGRQRKLTRNRNSSREGSGSDSDKTVQSGNTRARLGNASGDQQQQRSFLPQPTMAPTPVKAVGGSSRQYRRAANGGAGGSSPPLPSESGLPPPNEGSGLPLPWTENSRRGQRRGGSNSSDDDTESIASAFESASSIQDSLEEIRSRIGDESAELTRDETEDIRRMVRHLRGLMELVRRLFQNSNRVELANLNNEIEAMFLEVEGLLQTRFPDFDSQASTVGERRSIHDAAKKLDAECIASLLCLGILVDTTDRAGNTALHMVKYSGREDKVIAVVRALLEAGANANAVSASGETALHLAAKECQLGSIELLLEHGADINMQQRRKSLKPLHLACLAVSHQKAQAVKFLVDGGASLNDMSRSGNRPLDYAYQSLQTSEQKLVNIAIAKPSAIYWQCLRLRECVEAIAVLLDSQERITLNFRSSNIINQTYVFSGMVGLDRIPIRDARAIFRERRVGILIQTNEDLYNAVRAFHNQIRNPFNNRPPQRSN